MKRVLLSALALSLISVVSARADDKPKDPPEKKDRAGQLKELQDDFQKAFPAVVKEWREAKTDDEKNKALDKLNPLAERGYKLVAENPKDDVSFDTLSFLIGTRPPTDPPAKALELICEHHINNAKLVGLIMSRQFPTGPRADALLKIAIEKSTSKDIKGFATFKQAQDAQQKAESAKDSKETEKFYKAAEDLLDKVVKDFGDVKSGPNLLKDQASKVLFEIRNLTIGKTAPEVISKDLDDKEAKLSSLRGKVVVLDIWATWCGPCRAMIPHEREMVEKLKDKPFALVSISADEKKETLVEFLKKEKMPWTHWWEGKRKGGILTEWNVEFFPTIYVLDAKGVIRHKNIRGEQLEKAVEELIKEAGGK